MKKITAILLLIIITLSLFAGCGRETGTETSAVPTETEVPAETLSSLPEVDADPLIWRVTDGDGHTLYLFGTMHAGDERNETVMKRLDRLLSSCDALAVEFDSIAYEKDLAAATSDAQKMIYSDGTTVKDHLSAGLYEKMKAALSDAGQYSPLLDMYRPVMWETLLENLYVEKSSLSTEYAIDPMLINRAYELKIPVLEVESGSFQMGLLASFPDELYEVLIGELLDCSFEDYGKDIEALHEAWLSGDEAALAESTEETDDGLTEEERVLVDDYERKMINERNVGMAERAKEYIESGDKVFFAVGAGHMVGDAGIVSLLEKDGYTVKRISIDGGK